MGPPLLDRMDPSIGEASSVMGAMVTELIRRSLRGGVMSIGTELSCYVTEKVDATIDERKPVMEQIAHEVADNTARTAASEVAREEVSQLERTARANDEMLAAKIDETASSTQRVATELTSRIEETQKHVHEEIEQTERRVTDLTHEKARDLTCQIETTEKRVTETTRAELGQKIDDLVSRSKRTVAAITERLQGVKETTTELGNRLMDEQVERKTDSLALRGEFQAQAATLHRTLEEERAARALAEEKMREEIIALLRADIEELRQTRAALAERVAQLEKPRCLRRLFRKLMFWKK
jgi:hypothetical protein